MTVKKAFTLTELLIALGIIGAIAAVSIPTLVSTINKRALTGQLKNTTASIQQLMSDQMVTKKTKKLSETDFASPATLLRNENFSIATTCANPQTDCWKTTASGNDKITYKNLDGSVNNIGADSAVVLKNGAILAYKSVSRNLDGDKIIGNFYFDVNGNEPPNICGRDLFAIYVTENGKITNWDGNENKTAEEYISTCKSGTGSSCYTAVVRSGWKMDY